MVDWTMTAVLKYAKLSHKKLGLVAKMVRGKKIQDAFNLLELMPKKGAKVLYKVLKSAVANAVNAGKETSELYIEEVLVSPGPKIKRIRFTSRSRISHYEKARSFVKIVLNVK